MILDQINYWTIPAGMAISMLVGLIYFNPRVLGGFWQRAMEKSGISLAQKSGLSIALTLPLSALNSFVFAILLQWIGTPGPGESGFATGLRAGLIVWAGFSMTSLSINSLFTGATFKLRLINALHFLILYSAMGALFGIMQWG